MIDNGRIILDPERIIPSGDHRYKQINPHLWLCQRCGVLVDPGRPNDTRCVEALA